MLLIHLFCFTEKSIQRKEKTFRFENSRVEELNCIETDRKKYSVIISTKFFIFF